MKHITILGAGAWGSALGQVLAQNHNVTIWGRNSEKITALDSYNQHPSLENMHLSENIIWTSNIHEALTNTDILFLAIPTQFCRSVLKEYAHLIPVNIPVIQTAKGIEIETGLLAPQILTDYLDQHPILQLSGPGFAIDLAKLKPTAVSLAAYQGDFDIKNIQNLFVNTPLRPYAQKDIMGVALGGALKNILAIAAGFCIGHQLGEGAKSAIITRGFNEMMYLADMFKADAKTLYGLSGLGDLMLTANSLISRNYQYGYELGKDSADILTQKTVEGFHTLFALEKKIDLTPQEFPIFSSLSDLLQQKKSTGQIINNLLDRPFKQEL